MVIFADGFPEAWFGQRFEIKLVSPHPTLKIEGVMNGTHLIASMEGASPAPWLHAQAFAKLLLMGVISKVD